MAKLNLQEQIKVTNYRKPYADENYDDLILTNRASRSSGNISLLSLNKLIEYKDEAFEKIAGRPQPFRSYTKKDLDSLAKSIAEYGVIDPITVRPMG
ncbi:MAG: hypothetical protein HFE30_03970 [Clostridiales bacterium]|nr:hypothetical protein [Clostridiales bacterium]